MKFIVLFLFSFLLTLTLKAQDKRWIGQSIKDIRSQLKKTSKSYRFGSELNGIGSAEIVYFNGLIKYYLILLSKDSVVSSVFTVPKLKKDEAFFTAASCLYRDGLPLMAIVDTKKSLQYLPAKKAWIFDKNSKRFVETKIDGLKCEDEGYGI